MKANKKINKEEKIITMSSRLVIFLAFLEGSMVMLIELIGSKMLNGFYGNSLTVWSCVVSISILALTLGYYIGGILSKNENKIKTLSILFATSAFFVCLMPNILSYFALKYSDDSFVNSILSHTFFLIAPSIITLGATTPILIQIFSLSNGNSGKSSGFIYSISTIAGIFSTLLIGFYILPNFGWKYPLLISSILLLLIALIIKPSTISFVSLGLILSISFYTLKDKDKDKNFKTIYYSEGLMGQLKVVDHYFPEYDVTYRILFINGIAQSIIEKNEDANSIGEYVHKISASASSLKNRKALILGMGGGLIANELQKLNYKIDIVDIDSRMFDISKKFFYFKPKTSSKFYEDDARHFIKITKKQYELIVVDLCNGEVQPSNFFTLEGINELKELISNNGFILIQYQEKINANKISGYQSIAKTFIENGFHVEILEEPGEISSMILKCSKTNSKIKIDKKNVTNNCAKYIKLDSLLNNPYKNLKIDENKALILTDDKPKLEVINQITIQEWRKLMIKFYGMKLINN